MIAGLSTGRSSARVISLGLQSILTLITCLLGAIVAVLSESALRGSQIIVLGTMVASGQRALASDLKGPSTC
jgi:hypothetical protein